MKGLIMGVAGLGAVGATAYVTTGKTAVDDYVGIINRSPQEVYAALSAIGPDGVIGMPVADAPGAPRVAQKISKQAGKSVRVEVMLDDKSFASVEFEIEPAEGGKTRIAGEVDLDTSAINDAIRARGGPGLPMGAGLAEGMLDRAFAAAMERAVQQINDGGSLSVLALGQAGFARPTWGGDGSPSFGGGPGRMAATPSWTAPASARPRVSARPAGSTEAAVDPNRAVREHLREQQQVQRPGW